MPSHLDTPQIRRPSLLVSAARHGCERYNRARDLPRVIGMAVSRGIMANLEVLTEAEQEMENKRKTGDATYSITRHIELLIALLSELKLQRTDPLA